jgi:T-complex protein 1 subunit theta
LKEGSRHYAGLEEAILRNIDACKQISKITRTSLGPHGMNKMIVNQLDKLFITSDAATIVREIDVHHPAARMIAMASKMQDSEVGDGTNLVIVMAGELMLQAENLIKMGLHPSEILVGYDKAGKKCLELLEGLVAYTIENVRDKGELVKVLKSVVGSKHYGNENILAPLIAEAALISMPRSSKDFNVDNVRVQKVLGASLHDSIVVHGLAILKGSDNTVVHVKNAKIAVYHVGIETDSGDTKGTVLMTSAEELQNYTKGEEATMEKWIKELADAGVNVAIAASSVSEIAMHFLTKYNIMVIKIMSKFELRRIARTLGATTIGRQGAPTPDEMGHAAEVDVTEIGSTKVTLFRNNEDNNKISTIILRGSTNSMLDDSERAIDDGVNTIKSIVRDQRFCAGAGATEIHLASQIQTYAKT